MFTGIVECLGKIVSKEKKDNSLVLTIESPVTSELKVDQSVAHNGICLTVTQIQNAQYQVCAVQETMDKTTIARWNINDRVNLERCIQLNARLDGHIVQGHVDCTAECTEIYSDKDTRTYRFKIPAQFGKLIIEKGSVCVNGISLTCFNISEDEFDIAVIPYTFENTSIQFLSKGDKVNIEFDVVGKYILRMKSLNEG